ncbi:hypothetical protein CALCODRAFT_512181 [Calocera cornea HHB12733]|uniref:Alpha-type protein kinase domain-containing protein n=1 Tax=Calocera cornea HHB12733 TaxID=1353952 RepID=A0A165D7L8_9BASI|nr:hypothetical protein CALCODRAFT_512181 [Calocera cornea HHB12733]
MSPFDSLATLPSLSTAMAPASSPLRETHKRSFVRGSSSPVSASRGRRGTNTVRKIMPTTLGGVSARTSRYSSTIQKTQNFVVDEYRILIDPNDCQTILVKANNPPFEVHLYENPFARGTTKQAFKVSPMISHDEFRLRILTLAKLRLNTAKSITYPYAAKELFRDETALEVTQSSLYEVVLPPSMGRIPRKNPFPGLPRNMPIVLFDVQTHTQMAESGLGDLGQQGIDNFLTQHKCVSFAHLLSQFIGQEFAYEDIGLGPNQAR